MIETIGELFRHMEWADSLTWSAARPFHGDDDVRRKLRHIHMTQRAFCCIWRGEPLEFPNVKTAAEVQAFGQRCHEDIAAFIDSFEGDLDAVLKLPWSEELSGRFGQVHDTTIGQTMLQLSQHSTYHRGQVNMRLRQVGAEPPLVDFIAWLWRGKPAPQWPA